MNGITLPENVKSITIPAGTFDEGSVNEDGFLELPAGTVVNTGESETTLEYGGLISEDGDVTEYTAPVVLSTGSKSSKKYTASIDTDDIENDRTYLPLRFIMENLGASVVWDGLTRTVTIIG